MNIRRRKQHKVPSLRLTSMPDLIFTVLFFFMIVTHMRTETEKLNVETPEGQELTKPSNKRLVTNLYIGTDKSGNTRIQIGNHIIPKEDVGRVIATLRNKLPDEEADLFTVNIRADKATPMGFVTDVKQELRKAGALNIRYSAVEKDTQQH